MVMRSFIILACIALVVSASPSEASIMDLQIEYVVETVAVPSYVSDYQVFRNLQANDVITLQLLFDTSSATLEGQGSINGIGNYAAYGIEDLLGASMGLGGMSYQFAANSNTHISIGNDSGPNLIDYFGLNFAASTPVDWGIGQPGILSVENLFRDTATHQMFSGADLDEALKVNFANIDQSFIDFNINFPEWNEFDAIYVDARLSSISARRVPEPPIAILLFLGLIALAASIKRFNPAATRQTS